ncbi:MAG: thrombospondin type 3 repeat-containing protein [Candidatus Woesearchaeota archaeon]
MNKKSQATIFIILGILILLASFFLFFNKDFFKFSNIYKFENKEEINLYKLFNDCINDITFNYISENGLCDVEKEIEQEIQINLYSCLSLDKYRSKGYEVKANYNAEEISVKINEDNIDIYLIYPVEIKKDEKKFSFEKGYFKLLRKVYEKLDLDSNNKLKKDFFLVSSDKNLELSIPKNTKIQNNNKNEVSIYIKELCPLNPSIVNKVKYVIEPDLKFEPEAYITVKYRELFTKNLREDKLKVAFLNKNFWQELQSNSYPEKNQIKAKVSHFSEWSGSCESANKLGINLMFENIALQDSLFSNFIIERDLKCAYNLSGLCGYGKFMVYLNPDLDNVDIVGIYKKVINKIYDMHLIPVILINERVPETFWKHPGMCVSDLVVCKYGENEDTTDKPKYDYSGSMGRIVNLVDEIHKDIPEWPLYIQIWDEPNLAYRWHDLSITDYQINEYAKYYNELAYAIKQLPHSNSVYLMPAAIAPTKGMKKCELTPKYAKLYDEASLDEPIAETKQENAYMMVGDCKKLGYYDFSKTCDPTLPEKKEEKDCNSLEVYDDNCLKNLQNGEDKEQCLDEQETLKKQQECCTSQKNYINQIITLRKFYDSKMPKLFENILYKEPSVECNIENVKLSNQINQRIQDTVVKFCWDKIIEYPTNEYLQKLYFNTDKICPYMDVYADHSYPEDFNINFPGGENPFGMEAYKSRFNFVQKKCGDYLKIDCIPVTNEDKDEDNIIDIKDNCPEAKNEDQLDIDSDSKGDVCDDSDNDGSFDNLDLCPFDFNKKEGNDKDNDFIADECDNCPDVSNRLQKDLDLDSIGDVCDDNTDNDAIPEIGFENYCSNSLENCKDNCRYVPNGVSLGVCLNNKEKTCNSNTDCPNSECDKSQKDKDNDFIGDVCDNCPEKANTDQKDFNNNNIGNVCEDSDKDGFTDDIDLCPLIKTTENTEEECKAKELCLGKIMITETTWAVHPRIYPQIIDNLPNPDNKKFEIDDYKDKFLQAYENWKKDDLVLAVLPYHLGENESIVNESLRNYSIVNDFCDNNCIGKEIFNLLSGIENPIKKCEEVNPPLFTGECTLHKFTLQNLKKDVGAKNIVYKCYKCENNDFKQPPNNPEASFNVNGINYIYYGMHDCFEKQLSLSQYCPDKDGSVKEGFICDEIDIDGKKYIGIVRCEPSLTSNNALVHICGTLEQCGSKENCCDFGGTYGNFWHSCKKPN